MSGHSKWATIKRAKAVTDVKKGAVYARMGREIIVSAKFGGGDPAANFRLRQAIERAKAAGVPNDNIQRAVEKGTGAGTADSFEELTYEGYGPGGVAVMVRCTTDNRNRTAGDIRSYFTKFGGNLGSTGSVSWNFVERGEVQVAKASALDEDKLLAAAVDAGAEDLETDGDDYIVVVCEPFKLEPVRTALEKAGYKIDSSEVSMAPNSTVEVTSKDVAKQLLRLLDTLENHDDVQNVYANFDMNEKWLTEVMN
ncbi:MAG: YebC/PmpR family DNA-binding transcriptional regulator [Cyanobacteria bacterium SZAS-4]|nr:YebC/PmpR family DNA-binding transcriptional regulator [Cyanobacteria bacterium SZAS-4]